MAKLKVSIFALLCTVMLYQSGRATEPDSTKKESDKVSSKDAVIFDGQPIFLLPTSLGKFSAQDRAKSASSRIAQIANDPKFDPGSIDTADGAGSTEIVAGDVVIMSITDADGKASGLTRQELAAHDANILTSALSSYKAKQSIQGALQATSLQNIQASLMYLLFQPLTVRIFIFVLGFLALTILGGVFHRWVRRYIADSGKRFAMNKLITIGVYFFAVLFASIVFQEILGNLAVVLGAAAAGIAFALQSLIVSLAGWAAITFGDYLKIGDRVEISGIKGDVIDIGFIRTTLMEIGQWINGDFYTGRIVRIGNSYVFNNPVYNYSSQFTFLWDELMVSVKADASDVNLARNLLQKIAEEVVEPYTHRADTEWDGFSSKYIVGKADIHPVITMEAAADKLQFTVRYVVDPRDRRKVKDRLYTRILEEFGKSDGKLTLALP